MPHFKLDDIEVNVVLKKIKNIHLSVYPPIGHVRISAPEKISMHMIRSYVISKLNWIRQQKKKLQSQEREAIREYLDRESHYYNGKYYLLKIVETNAPPKIVLHHTQIELQVLPGSNKEKKRTVLEAWYRQQLKQKVNELVSIWEKQIGVTVSEAMIRKMKTKWGSCSPHNSTIRINLELVKKPAECLEYVVVHELVHLLEPSHNHRFILLMDKHLPKWRFYRDELNRLPVRHENWQYDEKVLNL
jgi:predicted metal-dependent hydrolase